MLSPQLWFTQGERPINVSSFTASLRALSAGLTEGAGAGAGVSIHGGTDSVRTGAGAERGCGEGRGRVELGECVRRREAGIPPNRQYSEVLDAIDACVARHW